MKDLIHVIFIVNVIVYIYESSFLSEMVESLRSKYPSYILSKMTGLAVHSQSICIYSSSVQCDKVNRFFHITRVLHTYSLNTFHYPFIVLYIILTFE